MFWNEGLNPVTMLPVQSRLKDDKFNRVVRTQSAIDGRLYSHNYDNRNITIFDRVEIKFNGGSGYIDEHFNVRMWHRTDYGHDHFIGIKRISKKEFMNLKRK